MRRGELGTTIARRTRPSATSSSARAYATARRLARERREHEGGVEQRADQCRATASSEQQHRLAARRPRRHAHHSPAATAARAEHEQAAGIEARGRDPAWREHGERHVLDDQEAEARGARRPGPSSASRSCRNARASLPLEGGRKATRACSSFSPGGMRPSIRTAGAAGQPRRSIPSASARSRHVLAPGVELGPYEIDGPAQRGAMERGLRASDARARARRRVMAMPAAISRGPGAGEPTFAMLRRWTKSRSAVRTGAPRRTPAIMPTTTNSTSFTTRRRSSSA